MKNIYRVEQRNGIVSVVVTKGPIHNRVTRFYCWANDKNEAVKLAYNLNTERAKGE